MNVRKQLVKNPPQGNHRLVPLKVQIGATLLIFMLILVVGASYSLLNQLNAATKLYTRQETTSLALAEVKQTLISYAVTYPERSGTVDMTAGPGYMSCPDTNNNGSPNTPCRPNAVGRFPGKFLDVSNYIDGSGERLWYAISDNFRNIGTKFQPMNSDAPAQLTVDGITDIVAVIIAPGEPGTGQTNRPSNNITDYLEGDNATTGDNSFTLNSGGNDVVTYITRQELMAVIEKRILAEVEDRINNYQATHSAFPWLSPFSNPSTSTFKSTAATYEGHIPYHYLGDVAGASNRNPFSTNISVDWNNIVNATTEVYNLSESDTRLGIEFMPLSEACLNDINDCGGDGIFPEITSLISAAAINCTWSNKETANCDSFSVSTTVNYVHSPVECPAGGTITRTYTISFPSLTGTFTSNPPDTENSRTRDVIFSATDPIFLPAQVNAIGIIDRLTGEVYAPAESKCETVTNLIVATGTSTFDANTEGDISVSGIKYDLNVDDGELPMWFVTNNWQDLIYISYASSEALPGDTTDILPGPADGIPDNACTSGTNCISVNINGTVRNNVRAAIFTAGADFPTGNARPSGTLTDYLENENSTPGDDLFVKNTLLTTTYNDQTRIISTAP